MLTLTTTTDRPQLCPLDGSPTQEFSDCFVVCTSCREILKPSETVASADESTWAAYLLAGQTDTDPTDAPLSRLRHQEGAVLLIGSEERSSL